MNFSSLKNRVMRNPRIAGIIDFASEFWKEWSDDKVDQLASSLAYYAIFSLSPLVIIGMAIISFFFEREVAQGQLLAQLQNVIGENSSELIASMLSSATEGNNGMVASIISFATLLWSAASVFGHLQNALNTIWDVVPEAKSSVWDYVRTRGLSFLLVLAGGAMGLLSLVLTSVFSSLSNFVGIVGFNVALWDAITNLGLTFVAIAILFALIYKVLPDRFVPWREAWFGALIASLLFVLGKSILGWYFSQNSAVSVYGAAGSLVALLLWIYYSSQIFFFGAEFTQVYFKRAMRKKDLATSSNAVAKFASFQSTDTGNDPKPYPKSSPWLGISVLAGWLVLAFFFSKRSETK